MRVIGVIDLRGGAAVHARGGHRERYLPVTAVGTRSIDPGDAPALARGYRDVGVQEIYVADLDAIASQVPAIVTARRPTVRSGHVTGAAMDRDPLAGGGSRDPLLQAYSSDDSAVAAIIDVGLPVWLDAGITSGADARPALALGPHRVVVGLETLSSWGALDDVCEAVGGERVAFSLDLRDGIPVRAIESRSPSSGGSSNPPIDARADGAVAIATFAAACGVGAIIVLDLARVGSRAGIDETLLTRIRHATPGTPLIAGGGVRGPEDLEALVGLGYDGALVATAILNGTLPARHIARAQRA